MVDGDAIDWNEIVDKYIHSLQSVDDDEESAKTVFEIGCFLRHYHLIYDPVGAALKWSHRSRKVIC